MANIDLAKEMGPERVEVPDTLDTLTTRLVDSNPVTDPIAIMEAAAWWYRHGGPSNPVYRWAITWLIQLLGSSPRKGSERYRNCKQYLKELGYDV